MPYISQNPADSRIIQTFTSWDSHHLAEILGKAHAAQQSWRGTTFAERGERLRAAAAILREKRDEFALVITTEMGKLLRESRAEVEKCAQGCEFYAANAETFLKDEIIASDAGKSYVQHAPLGVVLAVMPWNFPFWQVFRAAAPALMAGNGLVLKHASNVPRCALAIEQVFRDAGYPEHLFSNLMIEASQVEDAIASPHVHAVTLTGSEGAGRKVAAQAGHHLKKCVLELGGSDPFVVLADADLDWAASQAVTARYMNCGQSCIAAKRFILAPEIADGFVDRLRRKVETLKVGNPQDETSQLGPMARLDLREELHQQVTDSLAQGAVAVTGCRELPGQGAYYAPSILDQVTPKTRAWHEEFFGPVALVIRAESEDRALAIANETRFGLGSSIWSRDAERAEKLAQRIEAGCTFVNGMVKSDPRLPFGGVKASGFGRELSWHGIREFVNTKTVWVR